MRWPLYPLNAWSPAYLCALGSLSVAELAKQARLHGRSLLKKKKIELGDMPGPSDTDSECGEWQVGTATGESCCAVIARHGSPGQWGSLA